VFWNKDRLAILSIGLGIIVTLVLIVFFWQFLPEIICKDGWRSSSIGRQGACSHHGGVKSNGIYVFLILVFSALLGFCTTEKLKHLFTKKKDVEPSSKEKRKD
jgi:hypothetical protein